MRSGVSRAMTSGSQPRGPGRSARRAASPTASPSSNSTPSSSASAEVAPAPPMPTRTRLIRYGPDSYCRAAVSRFATLPLRPANAGVRMISEQTAELDDEHSSENRLPRLLLCDGEAAVCGTPEETAKGAVSRVRGETRADRARRARDEGAKCTSSFHQERRYLHDRAASGPSLTPGQRGAVATFAPPPFTTCNAPVGGRERGCARRLAWSRITPDARSSRPVVGLASWARDDMR
jgi:hypothetical protein